MTMTAGSNGPTQSPKGACQPSCVSSSHRMKAQKAKRQTRSARFPPLGIQSLSFSIRPWRILYHIPRRSELFMKVIERRTLSSFSPPHLLTSAPMERKFRCRYDASPAVCGGKGEAWLNSPPLRSLRLCVRQSTPDGGRDEARPSPNLESL